MMKTLYTFQFSIGENSLNSDFIYQIITVGGISHIIYI